LADDTDRFAVHQQEVIASARFERNLAEGNPVPGGKVQFSEILNYPSSAQQHRIDLLTS
jgi:hypothetical protein